MASIIIYILTFYTLTTGIYLLNIKQIENTEKNKFFRNQIFVLIILVAINLASFGIIFRNSEPVLITKDNIPYNKMIDFMVVKTTVDKGLNYRYEVTKRTLFGLPINNFTINTSGENLTLTSDSLQNSESASGWRFLIRLFSYLVLFILLVIYVVGLVGKLFSLLFKKTS